MPGFPSVKSPDFKFRHDSSAPLLDSYGSVPKSGMKMPRLPAGENASVIVVEVGENKVFITDLKGAREMLNDSKNTSWSPIVGPNGGGFFQSYRDDTLALVMSDDDHSPSGSESGYTVKPIPGSNGFSRPSREYSILEEFLRRIQSFPYNYLPLHSIPQRFGGPNGNESPWRLRWPLIITGSLLLMTVLVSFIWTLKFRGGFNVDTLSQFNLHPTFMLAGFLLFSGFSMLFYRWLTWYDKLTVKILHTAFHLFSIVCIGIGYTSAKTSMALAVPDKPSFYSLHSWLGLATMILFFAQFAFGFGSFIIAYFMCETRSAPWRAAFLPNHATLGLITFVMAAATAVTGLTEKGIFTLQGGYLTLKSDEAPWVNWLGMLITAATIAIVFTLRDDRTKRVNQPNIYNIQNFN